MSDILDRLPWRPIDGAIAARRARVDAAGWLSAAAAVREGGGTLIALWASTAEGAAVVRAAFDHQRSIAVVELALTADVPGYPSLAALFPAARRMQRAAFDMVGVQSDDADARPWLRHAAWPRDAHPLAPGFDSSATHPAHAEAYPFVTVAGEGVHEIAVGPVHAGIIEPGHFRFSVVGEKVLRLEQRLGYTHKGIELRFTALPATQARRLAARVSGDSAAAFSWAYCMALEGASGVSVPARAAALRALCLERERIANHLGDLGALGNDAGLAFGLAQFSRLKEDLLRENETLFGQRYPFDLIVPGGVARDLDAAAGEAALERSVALQRELETLREVYDDHAGLQDRFAGAGIVRPELAAQLGLAGLAGRASSQLRDARADNPCAPYDVLDTQVVGHDAGDVLARVCVRFDEIAESLRLQRALLTPLATGPIAAPLPTARDGTFGLGLVEGWRGPVLVALETGPDGTLRRCHPHDPSWQNWPALEHAVIDNIVPDFPLINKSFNLSYSGQDL